MLELLKKENNETFARTENDAAALASTGSDCLDLFASIGALRAADEEEIRRRFVRAFAEDRTTALRILFYARDIRGGLGERRVFRVILAYLAVHAPEIVEKILPQIAEYGRWDDVAALVDTPCAPCAARVIAAQMREDLRALSAGESVSLLAKWLPSINTSSRAAVMRGRRLARLLGQTEAQYRKSLVQLRRRIAIIEDHLRTKDYTFDYEKQPSRALFLYRRAFLRNDKERYTDFITRVERGEASMHVGTLYPYDIIRPLMDFTVIYGILQGKEPASEEERRSMDAAWRSLPDYTHGENALVVMDGSGSMYQWGANPQPIAVAVSLAVYFAERNESRFKNHFITFSQHPRLVEVKGARIDEKAAYCASFNEAADTNIQAVFELILETAVKNGLSQEELPARLYIISDMEFNVCTQNADMTNFAYAKELFASHGYTLPELVFWNVASRHGHQPVSQNEQGVMLVSGCSPSVFGMVVEERITPYDYMMQVLGSERYAGISA